VSDRWTHDTVVRYLLRELEGPALDLLEEELVESAVLQELVAAVEAELVDDYVASRLAPALHARFEASYGSDPAGRQMVHFARTLRQALPQTSLPAKAWRTKRLTRSRMAASFVLLALAATSGWWSVRHRTEPRGLAPPGPPAPARSASASASPERSMPAQTAPSMTINARPPGSRATDTLERFALAPGGARSVRTGQSLVVAAGVRVIQLELTGTAAGDASYEAEMLNPDADARWKAPKIIVRRRGGSSVLVATLALSALSSGDYVVRLSSQVHGGARQDVADYPFRLLRRAP
jgi:hypothetical protein